MKKLNKKGFTIVELVIVIAVIAILAGVLIPTFATVVEKANQSKAMQEAKNEYEAYLAEYAETLTGNENFYVVTDKYYFEVENGQFNTTANEKDNNKTFSNADLSIVYKVTSDTSAEDGKDYYTKNDNGTYTKATATEGTTFNFANDTTYYELVGDLGSANVAIYAAN